MKRIAQLFVLAACMSVPAIVSADGGLLSPINEIANDSAEIAEKVPEMVNVSSKGDSITDEAVEPVTNAVKKTTNTVDRVDQSTNESTKTVKPVDGAVKIVKNTIDTAEKTVEKVAPTETLKNAEPILDVNLSEKLVKVDVLDQEISVTKPTKQEKTEVEVKVPVVVGIIETEPDDENSTKIEPPPTPAISVNSEDKKEQITTVQKTATILEKELTAREIQKPVHVDKSGDVRNKESAKLAKDLPRREKTYPDYPASKMLTPSSSQSGHSPAHSTFNGSTPVSSTVAFLAVMDGNHKDSLLETRNRIDGQVMHYYDQWLNAPPGQPPQSFFF